MRAFDGLRMDLRLSVRSLVRTPVFTATAVLAMAIGIGGTGAVFAGFDTLFLKPLPLPDSERLARLYQVAPDGRRGSISPATYLELVKQTPSIESAAAF